MSSHGPKNAESFSLSKSSSSVSCSGKARPLLATSSRRASKWVDDADNRVKLTDLKGAQSTKRYFLPQVTNLGLDEMVDNDPCKFVLFCRGSSERFTLQSANVDIKQVWVQHIKNILDAQNDFLSGMDAQPIQKHKTL